MRPLCYVPPVCLWLSWMLFLSSFFLPAYDGLARPGTEPGTSLLGWQAMVDSIVVLTVKFWVVLFEPRFIVFFLAPLGNVLVLFTPFLVQNLREDSWPIAAPLVVFSAMMWFLPTEMYAHTLYGFWIWNLSALLMAIAVVINAIAMGLCDSAERKFRQNNAMQPSSR